MNSNSSNKTDHDFRRFSSFDRESRVDKYRSNCIDEKIIDVINSQLTGVDELIKKGHFGNAYPSIIIVGAPRSGTTLLSQLLPARYDIGYVSNLMARFYGSPLTGAWLQQKLIPEDIHSLRIFSSHHGVTSHVYEPHEFGYFWARYLNSNYDCHEPKNKEEFSRINFKALNTILSDISCLLNRPSVYKCAIATFLINSFLRKTNVFFVHIVRDKQSTINSIINVRKQRLGSDKKWWSIRPYGWNVMLDKPPAEQVAWQYDKVVESIRSGCEGYGNRICEITLEDLLQLPEEVLGVIMKAYAKHSGFTALKVGTPIEPFVSD